MDERVTRNASAAPAARYRAYGNMAICRDCTTAQGQIVFVDRARRALDAHDAWHVGTHHAA